jgi:hypothetical protein
LVEPGFIWVLMKRAGEPATCRMRLPGDIGGVMVEFVVFYDNI